MHYGSFGQIERLIDAEMKGNLKAYIISSTVDFSMLLIVNVTLLWALWSFLEYILACSLPKLNPYSTLFNS